MKSIVIFLIFFLIYSCNGVTFDCVYAEREWPVSDEKPYTCYVVDIQRTLDVKLTAVTSSSGHSSGKSNVDVKSVEILCENNLNFIPKEMDKFFPNFVGLKFASCQLSTLNADDLKSYASLQYFGAIGAGIKEVPGKYFESTPDMKAIDFTDNDISELSQELIRSFEKLKNLSWLSFKGNNNCSSKVAENKEEVAELIKELRETCSTYNSVNGIKSVNIFILISMIITMTIIKM